MDLLVGYIGVGIGHLPDAIAIGGLLGLGAAAGVMLADRLAGTMFFALCVAGALTDDHRFSKGAVAAIIVLALIVASAIARYIKRPGAVARIATACVLVAGAGGAGYLGGAWKSGSFNPSWQAWVAAAIVFVCSLIGFAAAAGFLRGAINSGGEQTIVGGVCAIIGLLFLGLSVFVPIAGFVVMAIVLVIAFRMRRRAKTKYQGLRILA